MHLGECFGTAKIGSVSAAQGRIFGALGCLYTANFCGSSKLTGACRPDVLRYCPIALCAAGNPLNFTTASIHTFLYCKKPLTVFGLIPFVNGSNVFVTEI